MAKQILQLGHQIEWMALSRLLDCLAIDFLKTCHELGLAKGLALGQ